ncbi:MAG: discoidin domain-containing protein [Saccharofermentanales bacterium]
MSKLEIKTFQQHGFDHRLFDCIDLPIAFATSYYRSEYYYCYCLIICVIDNWGKNNGDFNKSKNHILNKLNLKISSYKVSSREGFVNTIKQLVDMKKPVYFILDYYYMFYASTLYMNQHIPHGVLITGYDETRKLFIMQESAHMNFTGLYPLQITEDILYDMWEKSNSYFSGIKNSISENLLFSIEENEKKENDISILTILNEIQSNGITGRNNFVNTIQNFNNSLPFYASDLNQNWIRRVYYTSPQIFFEIIEMIFKKDDIDILADEFFEFKRRYLFSRDLTVSVLVKNAIKRKHISQDRIDEMMKMINGLDIELNDMIDKSLIMINKYRKTNYALKCKTTASSESYINNIKLNSYNAVNGLYDADFLANMWISDEIDPIHWIVFDLGQIRHINIIILRHDYVYPLIDYIIQASDDQESWDNLIIATNNVESLTIYNNLSMEYRYFRLYITNPSSIDNFARLYEFEAWN